MPFATAAHLLGWYSEHCQSTGRCGDGCKQRVSKPVETLQKHLHALAQGDLPAPEALAAELAAAPLVLGADGVLVPFRPTGGQPTGKTQWHRSQVGVLARLSQHRTRTGKVITRLRQRRLVAVLGDIEALKPRLAAGSRAPGHQHGPPGGLAQ